jgi:hypothetical protein
MSEAEPESGDPCAVPELEAVTEPASRSSWSVLPLHTPKAPARLMQGWASRAHAHGAVSLHRHPGTPRVPTPEFLAWVGAEV